MAFTVHDERLVGYGPKSGICEKLYLHELTLSARGLQNPVWNSSSKQLGGKLDVVICPFDHFNLPHFSYYENDICIF